MTSTPWGDPAVIHSPMQSLYLDEEVARVRRQIADLVDRLEDADTLLEDLGYRDLAVRCHELAGDLDLSTGGIAAAVTR